MKKYKKILFGIGLLIGLLVILPFLIPTATYLREAEQIASEKLGVPVTITKAHLFLLPSPRLALTDIAVGEHQEVMVERLVVVPTLSSLFSANKQLDLNITKPTIKKAALEIVSGLLAKKSTSSRASAIHIHHIAINEMQLIWPNMKLPATDAEMTLTAANQMESAVVKSVDGKLKAEVTPNGDEQLITVTADKWILPVGLPLLIDSANFIMHLKGSKLNVPKIDIVLYHGKLTGDAVLSWQEAKGVSNWQTSGHLKVDGLSVKEPSSMVSPSVYLSGDLFADGGFSANAKDATQLAERLQANFKFKINNGVLHGLDLVKVASLFIKQNQTGGETQFDAFSGLLNMAGKQYHLHDLKISSGLLSATGQVKIKPDKTLDGQGTVEVKSSASLVAIPLEVSGTVNKPVVLPSKTGLLGAAAGTAMLGPGVGTSLGIKAAGALDSVKNLFGGKK